MKRLSLVGICIGLLLATLPSNSFALGPELEVDCGNWVLLRDTQGSYRELTAVAYYNFAGDSFKYKVNYFGSSKEKFSRGTFQGTYTIENPELASRTVELPLNTKFRNNKYESFMYKTKYIKAMITFTDSQGYENRKTCIWKWK
jgi:hypothetical protein